MTKSVQVVGVHEAKTNLSRLLRLVESGAEVQIRRGNVAVARLVPVEAPSPPKRLGFAQGEFEVPGDFDATDSAIIDAFENSVVFPS